MGNINLEQMKVYAAPFGGPIAITKERSGSKASDLHLHIVWSSYLDD
jgi:hypothetical protein